MGRIVFIYSICFALESQRSSFLEKQKSAFFRTLNKIIFILYVIGYLRFDRK